MTVESGDLESSLLDLSLKVRKVGKGGERWLRGGRASLSYIYRTD
jgi:hypothetical protein